MPTESSSPLESPEAQQTTATDVRKTKGQKCKGYIKKGVTFLFSHIGLCGLVFGYTVMGGFLFRWLEAPYEVAQKENVAHTRRETIEKMWKETVYGQSMFHKANWTTIYENLLKEFQVEIVKAILESGWDGKESDSSGDNVSWSFAGALLYAVTVITTIGYGHIAPKTTPGRIVTIAYALIGIPLTLLCLANLSSFMGNGFRFIYNGLCRLLCKCCKKCRKAAKMDRQKSGRKSKSPSKVQLQLLDIESGNDAHKTSPTTENKTLPTPDTDSHDDPKENCGYEIKSAIGEYRVRRRIKTKDGSKVSVPIWISVLVIAGYILGGAVLFSKWEDMNFVDGCYFVFITLSTIGFGDIVPGTQKADTWATQEKLILISLYVLFGLATIAMCFDLMQEDVRNKVEWIGKKIGLIDGNKHK